MRIHVYIYLHLHIHIIPCLCQRPENRSHFSAFRRRATTFGTGKDRNPHVQKLSGGKGRESVFFETNGVKTWKNV